MLSSLHVVSRHLGRYAALTSLLVACSSDDGAPNNPGGSAGAGGSAAGAAGAGAPSAGTAGTSATAGTAGSAQGGSAAGAGGTGGGSAGGGAGGMGGSGGAAGGSAGAGGGGAGGAVNNGPFELKSSAFKEGEQVPLKYKCAEVNPKGENISPPLNWGPGPAGTKSYAIVLEHLPTPEHWVIWDIPLAVTSLAENIEHAASPAMPAGAKQSLADLDGFKGSGYLGPCPQAFNSVQQYKFTLYALDVETVPGLSATSSPGQAATAVKQHIVAGSQGKTLTGTQIRMN